MNPEGRYITNFHNRLKRKHPQIWVQKISQRYSGGMPDVYYTSFPDRHLWVEYKYVKTMPPRKLSVKNLLSPLQRAWLVKASLNDISTAVIIGSESEGCLPVFYGAYDKSIPGDRIRRHLVPDLVPYLVSLVQFGPKFTIETFGKGINS